MRNALFIFAAMQILAVTAFDVLWLHAQSPDAQPLTFEVASIKANKSVEAGGSAGLATRVWTLTSLTTYQHSR
jgi:hypothetical protein